jgi:parallel beta-helix repeat protein
MKFTLAIVCCFFGTVAFTQTEFQKKFQTSFIEVEDGGMIELPGGTYFLEVSLWLDGKENVTIRGKGMDKTILNFKDQISGAEGIKVTNASNITIADLTVQDTKGDGVKAQQVNGIVLRNVKAEWTRGAHSKNGGYGLYPVQCDHVLIENCVARGASDAGIYVGQSNYVIVRNNKAYENVAGIEIENTSYADVYENEAYNNTGGLLIFDLPDLVKKKGGYCRAFNNNIHDNNHINFAPKGNIVGKVPLGTGVMIMAANNVELFNNKIHNNITASTAVVSYYISENPIKDSLYYPLPEHISIHNNDYQRPGVRATMRGRMGKLYRFKLKFGKDVPHIVWDGIVDEKAKDKKVLCIVNNTNASFANIDAENNFKNISRNMNAHDCSLSPLAAVRVNVK